MCTTLTIEHLYLHFPFCTGRCNYCAFISGPPPKTIPSIIHTLQTEATQRAIPLAPLKSLYCGGGTPGLIGSEGFQTLTNAALFTFADKYEWTVELHPATVTPTLIATLASCGVNRISIGVQSLNDDTLKHCNRRHTAQQALDTIALARSFIPDTGIDLIAGLPGITPAEWTKTLNRVISLDLPHLSVYALSIDEGSTWAQQGRTPPDPDQLCDAIGEAHQQLTSAGYDRYETSNYAKPGFQCRHNLNTWHGGDYLGLGYGASSRIGLMRRDGFGNETTLDEKEDALERCLTQLRLSEGLDLQTIDQTYPCLRPYLPLWAQHLKTFQQHGLLTPTNAPTCRGYEILDAMERTLLESSL